MKESTETFLMGYRKRNAPDILADYMSMLDSDFTLLIFPSFFIYLSNSILCKLYNETTRTKIKSSIAKINRGIVN